MANVALIANIADQTASQAAGAAAQLVPSGTVFHFAGSTAPTGWLICDGSAVSRTTYAALFAAIGTTYGTGDGSTTFNLPDCRGIFISGTGSQTISSITYTRTHGAKQGDTMQGHYHDVYQSGTAVGLKDAGSNVTVPSISQNSTSFGGAGTRTTAQAALTDTTNGTPRTGAETRPANIAMNHIIKV